MSGLKLIWQCPRRPDSRPGPAPVAGTGGQIDAKSPYLPKRRGFLYLVAMMDWFTRKVLAWRISSIEPWVAIGSRAMARGG